MVEERIQGPVRTESPAEKNLKDALSRLQGAFVNQDVRNNITCLTAHDPKLWLEHIEQLQPFVWDLVRDAYGKPSDDSDPEIVTSQLIFSFKDTKQLYLKHEGGQVIGYVAEQPVKEDPTVAVLADVNVTASRRKQGFGAQLCQQIFDGRRYEAFIGVSVNPFALKPIASMSQRFGYECMYAPEGTGNEQIERLKAYNTEDLRSKDVLIDKPLPPGYEGCVLVKPDYLPPISEADLTALAGHPFERAARKIFELQKTYRLGENARASIIGQFFCVDTLPLPNKIPVAN